MTKKELIQKLESIPDDYDIHIKPNRPYKYSIKYKYIEPHSTTNIVINISDYNKRIYLT